MQGLLQVTKAFSFGLPLTFKLCLRLDVMLVNIQKQPPEVFFEKGVLRNFAKFTGKQLCQSLFLIKLQAEACNFIKKETCNFVKKEALAQVFACEFCQISENNFFKEHLRTTASIKVDTKFCGCKIYVSDAATRGALRKSYSGNMQWIYRRTPIPKMWFK